MKIFFTLLMTAGVLFSWGQPLPYDFSILNESYVPFDNGTSLTESIEWDDDYYSAPIGFSFSYMDSSYEYISAIGIFGGLGSELILGEYDESGVYDIMCPALLDLVDAAGAEQSDISYITEGEPGSRIFKMQWTNCSIYGDKGPTNSRVDMQIWLYEATNSIDFRYGPTTSFNLDDYLFLNGLPIFIGNDCEVDGASSLPTNIWALTGSAANADFQSYQTLDEFYTGIFLEDYPANGVVYHFAGVPDHVEPVYSSSLVVYPTVSETMVNVSGIAGPSDIMVFDATGSVVFGQKVSQPVFRIDIASWSAGVYFIQLCDDRGMRTAKVIRQ